MPIASRADQSPNWLMIAADQTRLKSRDLGIVGNAEEIFTTRGH